MAGVQRHDVGALADRDRADVAAERLRATGERGRIEMRAGRLAFALRQHIAAAVAQALRIFELAQLGRRLDLDLGIGADAEAAAGFRESATPSKTPSPSDASVSGHSPATAPDAASRARLLGHHVRRVDQAPARVDAGIVDEPRDRPLAQRGDAVLHLLHLLGGMDVHRALRVRGENFRERIRRDGAQRMRRDADARIGQRFQMPRERASSAAKRSID